MLNILFDGDMLVFESCSSVETPIDWGEGLWTLHANASDAEVKVEDKVATITNLILDKMNYEGQYKIILCFSDMKKNFRKTILPTYKANRIGKRKPICYMEVRNWCMENYNYVTMPALEADDCVGILATKYAGHEVHTSGDKDFKSIPGVFYDFLHNDLYHISEEEADKWFYTQCLIGDTADNYSGCPGIGPKTAEKIFKKEGASWQTVLNQFLRKGFTKEEALQQARVARILRITDMTKNGSPMWHPKQ